VAMDIPDVPERRCDESSPAARASATYQARSALPPPGGSRVSSCPVLPSPRWKAQSCWALPRCCASSC
jgi:hypothetical protein